MYVCLIWDNRSWLRGKTPWIHASVMSNLGPLTYRVKTDEGGVWQRHVEQIRKTSENYTQSTATDTALNERYFSPPTNNTFARETRAIPCHAKPNTDHGVWSTDPPTPRKRNKLVHQLHRLNDVTLCATGNQRRYWLPSDFHLVFALNVWGIIILTKWTDIISKSFVMIFWLFIDIVFHVHTVIRILADTCVGYATGFLHFINCLYRI